MKVSQYNRRSFLGSLAILSVGTAFGSTAKQFSPGGSANDLQKEWNSFWKKSGGRAHPGLSGPRSGNNSSDTKGHSYKYGDMIYFPKEDILAQPTWIFWNDGTKAADVVVSFYDNNQPAACIIRLNRYEMEALYRLSEEPGSNELLSAFLNSGKRKRNPSAGTLKTKTSFKQRSRIQEISYCEGQTVILHKKFIYHV